MVDIHTYIYIIYICILKQPYWSILEQHIISNHLGECNHVPPSWNLWNKIIWRRIQHFKTSSTIHYPLWSPVMSRWLLLSRSIHRHGWSLKASDSSKIHSSFMLEENSPPKKNIPWEPRNWLVGGGGGASRKSPLEPGHCWHKTTTPGSV